MNYCYYCSPIGWLHITDNGEAVTSLHFADNGAENGTHSTLQIDILRQLKEYFAGTRTVFALSLAPAGTLFQQSVWNALQNIPFGETRTYAQIAAAIGNPRACRAVGMANHRNPIAILIPCHRVIGANAALTGYAGGLERKKLLLALENKHPK